MTRLTLLAAFLVSLASAAFSQGVGDYVYVHRTKIDLKNPPWQCVCYSVSKHSLIMSNDATRQTWPVSRFNDWAAAVAERNKLSVGSNVCAFCSAPMALGGGGAGGGGGMPGVSVVAVYLFGNCNGPRCIMGVADGTYSEPGWEIISPAFNSHPEAWRYACSLHQRGQYKAPAIEDGKIDCGALGGGSEGLASGATRQETLGQAAAAPSSSPDSNGKYCGFVTSYRCPEDGDYPPFSDYGYWRGGQDVSCSQTDLPGGYYVYHVDTWYVYREEC